VHSRTVHNGELIREARKAKGLTQAELGGLVGVSQPTIGRWETNQLTPKLADLAALVTVLDLSWSDFDPEQVAS
jgi:transcriptional regulator with XRE-family HTH domain